MKTRKIFGFIPFFLFPTFLAYMMLLLLAKCAFEANTALGAPVKISSSQIGPEPVWGRAVFIDGAIQGQSILKLGQKLLQYTDEPKLKVAKETHLDPVFVILNSPGGEVYVGAQFLSYLDAVKSRGVEVHCYVQGMAASMAYNILTQCDKRFGLESSLYLWHPPRVYGMQMALTPTSTKVLYEQLAVIDTTVWEQVKSSGFDAEFIKRHYDLETLHTGKSLDAVVKDRWLRTYAVIPNLLNVPESVPRLEKNLFSFLMGGSYRILHILSGEVQ